MGGSKQPGASSGEKALANISKKVYRQSDPIRQQFLDQGLGLLTGQMDPRQLPGFQLSNELMQEQTGDFFNQARDQILGSVPVGATGLQSSLLADAATQGAQQRSTLANQIAMQLLGDYLNKAYGIAAGAPQTAVSGLGQSAQAGAQRRMAGAGNVAAGVTRLIPNINVEL